MSDKLKPKGLILSMIIEAESANYGEGISNFSSLKKLSMGSGEQYTYISRQAIRYNIVNQFGENVAKVKAEGDSDKKVIQFDPDATIKDFPELDFFGYMKTKKGETSSTRSAVVRLSNAISLETFKGDIDYLTNKGLADRLGTNMNIAQSEIHRSYYRYTIVADLDLIGIDEKDKIYLENSEKARRVCKLLDTIAFLYRDIRGRREDLKPLFAIGGIYDVKNPIFQNIIDVKNNRVNVYSIESVISDDIRKHTFCGLVEGKFYNDNEIKEKLGAIPMYKFFNILKDKVKEYYESN